MALGIRGQLTEFQQLNAPDKLVIFAMGRLWRPIVPDAEREPIYSVSRSLHFQAHQSGSSRRANLRAPHPGLWPMEKAA
jgi:hypothetical protein